MVERRIRNKSKKPAAKERSRAGTATKKRTAVASGTDNAPDPRFEPVAKALARTPGFSLMESKSKALRGMMLNGKSFGMSTHGRFILKLDEERAAALIADRVAKPFGTGPRVMKGWVEITAPDADWVALAKEAQSIAAAAKPRIKTRG
jgi:hypothetical protein